MNDCLPVIVIALFSGSLNMGLLWHARREEERRISAELERDIALAKLQHHEVRCAANHINRSSLPWNT